jgi:hypothetical protein
LKPRGRRDEPDQGARKDGRTGNNAEAEFAKAFGRLRAGGAVVALAIILDVELAQEGRSKV